MTKYLKILPYIVIAALAILLFLAREFPSCPDCDTKIEYRDSITEKVVLVPVPVNNNIPKPKPIHEVDSFPMYMPVDTGAILADYNKKRDYDVPLINDSTGTVSVKTSVYQNKLGPMKVYGTIQSREHYIYTNTVVKEEPKRKLFLGATLTSGLAYFGASADVMYVSKKDHPYRIAIDPFNRTVSASTYLKIKFKK